MEAGFDSDIGGDVPDWDNTESRESDEDAAWRDLVARFEEPTTTIGPTPWPERENVPGPRSQATRGPDGTDGRPGADGAQGAGSALGGFGTGKAQDSDGAFGAEDSGGAGDVKGLPGTGVYEVQTVLKGREGTDRDCRIRGTAGT